MAGSVPAGVQTIAPAPLPSAADEWEYEYDENETEDVYFTLDLTTHVPDALVQKQAAEDTRQQRAVDASARASSAQNTEAPEELDDDDEDAEPAPSSTLQILDLHTTNPLIKFDSGVYTCYWSSDLGTQLHIAEAGATINPRKPGAILDVVGTSQSRLLGKPVHLKPRQNTPTSRKAAVSARRSIISVDEGPDADQESSGPSQDLWSLQARPGVQLQIPRHLCKDKTAEAQASFLERLSAIKIKKGEKDSVPPFTIKYYNEPPNMEEIRQAALAADAEKVRKERDEELLATSQRPRKRRRKLTNAEKGVESRRGMGVAGRPSSTSLSSRLGLESRHDEDATPEMLNGTHGLQGVADVGSSAQPFTGSEHTELPAQPTSEHMAPEPANMAFMQPPLTPHTQPGYPDVPMQDASGANANPQTYANHG